MIDDVIANEIAKSNGRIIMMPYNLLGLKEWIKWLEYKATAEDKIILELIIKYDNHRCDETEYMIVYNYLNSHSLEQTISNKLDKYDLELIRQKMLKLRNKSESEIYDYIRNQQSNYENLSMIDAYVLHIISKEYYQNDINRMINEITIQIDRNAAMHQKSMVNALNLK